MGTESRNHMSDYALALTEKADAILADIQAAILAGSEAAILAGLAADLAWCYSELAELEAGDEN